LSNGGSINNLGGVRVREPEAKRRRLLDAALIEFSATGLAATRTDAIARTAQCSAGLVYTYFKSKEGLFDAVLDDITERTVDEIPITVDDLPEYAARLYDSTVAHPQVERFVAWYQLERSAGGQAAVREAVASKIGQVERAQRDGLLPTRLSAAELVLTVQSIARMWATQPPDVVAAVEPTGDQEVRRQAVRSAVRALLEPPPSPR
jgi:AcrR family transcriptional regulator